MKKALLLPYLSLCLFTLLLPKSVFGVTLNWDPNGTGGPYGGNGNWDTSSSFWNTSATLPGTVQAWVNSAATGDSGDIANFIVNSGSINVTTGIVARTLSTSADFTFSGSSITLTRQFATALSIGASNTVTFNNLITLLGGGQTLAAAANSTTTLAGGVNVLNTDTLTLNNAGGSNMNFSGAITKSAGNLTLQVGINGGSNGSTYRFNANNTGLTTVGIDRGTVYLNNNGAMGTSSITMGDSAGNTNNSLLLTESSGLTIANNITVSTFGDTADSRTIGGAQTSGTSTFSGAVTLGQFAASGVGSSLLVTSATGGTTVFSGLISDGANTTALTKSGAGVVVFSRAAGNTYDGGTTVTAGTLLVNNTSGSGLGTGAATVTAGTLGGSGFVNGNVTIGNGTGGSDSFISPGNGPGTFTTAGSLSLLSDATFVFELNSSTLAADKLVANGVTLNASSQFSFTDLGAGSLTVGTVFLVIDNTSGSAISGVFGNLANGSTFTSGANQFQVSYSGGVGSNDLTFTVVPEPSTAVLLMGVSFLVVLKIARARIKFNNA